MKTENPSDRTKSADIGIALYYGNNLLRNTSTLFDYIADVTEKIKEYNPSKSIVDSLVSLERETKMMQIGINSMIKVLSEYKAKENPAQEEEGSDEFKMATQTNFKEIKNIDDLLSRNKTTLT